MPRKTPQKPTISKIEAANRAIRQAAAREGVGTNRALGRILGVSEAVISRRFSNGWKSLAELQGLDITLKFTDEEWLQICKGRRAT